VTTSGSIRVTHGEDLRLTVKVSDFHPITDYPAATMTTFVVGATLSWPVLLNTAEANGVLENTREGCVTTQTLNSCKELPRTAILADVGSL